MIGGILLALAAMLPASAADRQRTQVPIHEVVLSDGTHRYGVPIVVDGQSIEAGLDTGSVGLRVLPGVLPALDPGETSRPDRYGFAAGAELTGVVVRARLAIGTRTGVAEIQRVQRVGCVASHPGCAAGSIPLARYGILGDGIPGEGFKAILGIGTGAANVPNPLVSLGIDRWIVALPPPGATEPGLLVVDPTERETAGYAELPMLSRFADKGGLHDAVSGCLENAATGSRICGAVLADTGAPGIAVAAPDMPGALWPNGTPATLTMTGKAGQAGAVEHLTIGLRAHASRLTFQQWSAPATIISAGLAPYFAFSVLYDAVERVVGFRPAAANPGGPRGELQGDVAR